MYLVSKTETFAKLFFLVSLTGFLAYVVLAFFTYHVSSKYVINTRKLQDKIQRYPNSDVSAVRHDKDFKFVLLWTTKFDKLFLKQFGEGQKVFIENKCTHVNCYMTTDKNLLNGDETAFDAIVLNKNTVKRWKNLTMPQKRSPKQKYIFFSHEPPLENVICGKQAENYFNWTWTFKLYSNIFRPFIEVKDLRNKIIAPSFRPDWSALEQETDLDNETLDMDFSNKSKALIWVLNACGTVEDRQKFTFEITKALKEQKLSIDIYGCFNGAYKGNCPKGGCGEIIKKDYYFYLAYETERSEDFVTTEVLKAYDNYAVPIVIGGADYTKFLPPGSFIDGNKNSVENLVGLILYFMKDPDLYNRLHRWRKYYTISATEFTRGVCELCKDLNDYEKMMERSSYQYFRKWWYPGPLYEVCLPGGAEKFEDVLSYLNDTRHG